MQALENSCVVPNSEWLFHILFLAIISMLFSLNRYIFLYFSSKFTTVIMATVGLEFQLPCMTNKLCRVIHLRQFRVTIASDYLLISFLFHNCFLLYRTTEEVVHCIPCFCITRFSWCTWKLARTFDNKEDATCTNIKCTWDPSSTPVLLHLLCNPWSTKILTS